MRSASVRSARRSMRMSPNTVDTRRGGVPPTLRVTSPKTLDTSSGVRVPTISARGAAAVGRSASSSSSSALVTAA